MHCEYMIQDCGLCFLWIAIRSLLSVQYRFVYLIMVLYKRGNA